MSVMKVSRAGLAFALAGYVSACGGSQRSGGAAVTDEESASETARPKAAQASCARGDRSPGMEESDDPRYLAELRVEVQGLEGSRFSLCPNDVLYTGDQFHLEIEPREPIFLHVIYIGPDGSGSLLYESSEGPLDDALRLPPQEGMEFHLEGEPGVETLLFIASEEPLNEAAPTLERRIEGLKNGEPLGSDSPLRSPRGKIGMKSGERATRLVPDAAGVSVASFPIRHQPAPEEGALKGRGIIIHEADPGTSKH